jgi:hypothetical protein
MKRLIFVLTLLGLVKVASAQETYSLPAGAGNVATLTTLVTKHDGDTCQSYALPRTCTQAQICIAASTPGGASCTAAQARAADVRIYPNTFAGREEYVTFEVALPQFLALVSAQQSEDRRAFCENWNAASVSTRNTFCTSIGLGTGCNPGC